MVTNIVKTKAEIILYLVMSLNAGDSSYVKPASHRVDVAIEQYNELVRRGIIKEVEREDEYKLTTIEPSKLFHSPAEL